MFYLPQGQNGENSDEQPLKEVGNSARKSLFFINVLHIYYYNKRNGIFYHARMKKSFCFYKAVLYDEISIIINHKLSNIK